MKIITLITAALFFTIVSFCAYAGGSPLSDFPEGYERNWSKALRAGGVTPSYPYVGLPSALTAAAAFTLVDCTQHYKDCAGDFKKYSTIYHSISPLNFIEFEDGYLEQAATFANKWGSDGNFQKEPNALDLVRAGLQKDGLVRYGCAPLPDWNAADWKALEDLHRQAVQGKAIDPRTLKGLIQATHLHLDADAVLVALKQPSSSDFLNRLFSATPCAYQPDYTETIGLSLKTFPSVSAEQNYEAVFGRIQNLLRQKKAIIVSNYCASGDDPIQTCARPVSFLIVGSEPACKTGGECVDALYIWLPSKKIDDEFSFYSSDIHWRVSARALLDRTHYTINSLGWIEF